MLSETEPKVTRVLCGSVLFFSGPGVTTASRGAVLVQGFFVGRHHLHLLAPHRLTVAAPTDPSPSPFHPLLPFCSSPWFFKPLLRLSCLKTAVRENGLVSMDISSPWWALAVFWFVFAFCSTWFVAVICLRISHPCLFFFFSFFLFLLLVMEMYNGNVSCPGFIDRMSL